MKNIREFFGYLFLVTFLFIGCKENNVELPDVELKILSSNIANPDFHEWTDTLAVFDTPWSTPLDLSNKLTFHNSNESKEDFELKLHFQEADLNKEIFIFRAFATGLDARNIILGNEIQTSDSAFTFKFSLDSQESYTLFFIDGFGDILTSSISVTFESINSEISETSKWNPNQSLKNEPTLRIDADDLSFSNSDSLYGKVEVITLGNNDKYEPLIVIKMNNNSSFAAYSTSSGYASISQRTKMDESFKVYLFTVDHYSLNE